MGEDLEKPGMSRIFSMYVDDATGPMTRDENMLSVTRRTMLHVPAKVAASRIPSGKPVRVFRRDATTANRTSLQWAARQQKGPTPKVMSPSRFALFAQLANRRDTFRRKDLHIASHFPKK